MSTENFLFDADGNIIAEVVVCGHHWRFLPLNMELCEYVMNLGYGVRKAFVDYDFVYQRYRKRIIADGNVTLLWDNNSGYVFYKSDKRCIVIGHAVRPDQRYCELTLLMECHAQHLGYYLC